MPDRPSWLSETGEIIPPPAARLLGFDLHSLDREAMTIEIDYEATEVLLNAIGHVQGGMLCAMLDSVLGSCLVATLADGEWAPTVDLQVQFHSPAVAGPISGRARVVRRGGSIAFTSGELSQHGTVVATATATSAVRRGR